MDVLRGEGKLAHGEKRPWNQMENLTWLAHRDGVHTAASAVCVSAKSSTPHRQAGHACKAHCETSAGQALVSPMGQGSGK